MSDTLEKLLAVEKKAAALVAEAEAEARHRTARARAQARQRHSDLLTAKAAETEKAIADERRRIAEERSGKNAEFRTQLERRTPDREALGRVAAEMLKKGTA
jgi:vacuolar-type H+-ATPase subunit H